MQFPSSPSFRLDGKRALVLGAGKGLGMASAIALAEAGAEVTAVSRTIADLEALRAHLADNGHKCLIHILDVADVTQLRGFIRDGEPYDVLVNSAGTNIAKPALEYDEESYDYLNNINVKSAYYALVEAAKKLVAAGKPGSLITISSQMGHVGGLKRTVYCSTKHAVEGFTKSMAWEWGGMGIRVNTICPTFIETSMTAQFMDDQKFLDHVKESIALGRIGRIEDVMGAVVFLASDASALITGSALMLDGGWTAR